MSHYYPRHVSGLDMPILRRNNCTNTASGILALELSELSYIKLVQGLLCCNSTVYLVPPEDGHVKARNMSRIVM